MSLFVHDKYIYNSQTAISTVFLQSIHIMVSQSAHFQPSNRPIYERAEKTGSLLQMFFLQTLSFTATHQTLSVFSLCVSAAAEQ